MTADEVRLAQQVIPQFFSRLKFEPFEVKSCRTVKYNCIAWAAGDEENVWWPGGKYWPSGIRPEESVPAFVAAFATLGYVPCDSADFEPGFGKIALYVNERNSVTHAARQLPDGRWTSKLGPQWDINHLLEGVCGLSPAYGRVAQILKRARPPQETGV